MKLAQVLLDEGSPHRSKQPSSKRLLMTLPQLLRRVILILSLRLSMKSTAEIMTRLNLPLREILGLDGSLKTIRGAKAVQEGKRVALLQSLEGLRENLERAGTPERADQIEREIQNAEDQLKATEDSIAALDQESGSQIRQIRDSLLRVLDKNTTLAERVRTLFREQGVTIASILTAIGMAISTLVLALTGGGAAAAPVAPTPAPPADKAGLKEWAKKAPSGGAPEPPFPILLNLLFSAVFIMNSPGFQRVTLIPMRTTLFSSGNCHTEKQPFWKKALRLKSN